MPESQWERRKGKKEKGLDGPDSIYVVHRPISQQIARSFEIYTLAAVEPSAVASHSLSRTTRTQAEAANGQPHSAPVRLVQLNVAWAGYIHKGGSTLGGIQIFLSNNREINMPSM